MIKVWGRANSNNVKKVLWCLAELELPYERIDAGMAFGVVETPEFRAMNPNGLVPVLQDGALVLWESNAIVRYLSARYSDGLLHPSDPGARALGDRWMDWTSTAFFPAFRDLFWGVVRTPAERRDAAAIARSLDQSASLLAFADAELARHPYLSGDEFGMGDIPLGCFIHPWFQMEIDRPAMPHLEGWYRRLADRPAYRSTVALPLT